MSSSLISSESLSRLATQHHSINFHLAPLSLEQIQEKPASGKWSIQDHLAHLGRYQEIFTFRLNRIITEPDPSLERYRAENDPDFRAWQQATLSEIRKALNLEREKIHRFVKTLDKDQIKRTGQHPSLGQLSIPEWIEFFLLHEAHHLYTIFKLSKTKS